MVRVYLDEDVSVLLANLLQSRHIDALTARDAHMLTKGDEEHLQFAIFSQRIPLTHNRDDFGKLYGEYVEKQIPHFGIVVLSRKRDVYASAQRLIKFFSANKNINNQLWYL